MQRAGHWTFAAVAWSAAVALFALRFLTTPDPRGHSTHEQLGLPPCTMIEVFDIPCPGCGFTTALSHFAHGEFAAAAVVQPFGALIAVAIVAAACFALAETLAGRDAWADVRRAGRPWMFWAGAAALLVSWIYKVVAVRA